MDGSARTLVIDTATAACSVALFAGEELVAEAHETVGRGHAERLVPMIAGLPGGGRADAILVDVGPGSFTGLRVGIAAATGLGIGWDADVAGYSSLALIAAGVFERTGGLAEIAVAIEGGHGELFVQNFAAAPLAALGPPASLAPAAALAFTGGRRVAGNVALVADTIEALPRAADALRLPRLLRTLPPRPFYLRAPDARPATSAA